MGQPPREHEPVLVRPLMRLLAPAAGQVVLDGTVGLGGHAAAILPLILPGGRYIGLDVDAEMLAVARERLAQFGPQAVVLEAASYTTFPQVLERLGIPAVDAMLLDLGVNSAQLAASERGFSFEREGPLDMRFDRGGRTAALDLVNSLSEKELADLIFKFGQDNLSRRIARRICQVRHEGRITTTRQLAAAVESIHEGGKIHPATRVFQALRIAVNRELENLETFLRLAPGRLKPGGKLAVISFHSLEDGAAKRAMRGGPLREITKRPEVADAQERNANPRSRSAKLRVAVRVEQP